MNKKIWILIVSIIVLAAIGFYLFGKHSNSQPQTLQVNSTSTPQSVSISSLSTLPSISSDTSAFSQVELPVAGRTIIAIRPAPYNFTTTSTVVGGVILTLIQPTKIDNAPQSKMDAAQFEGSGENLNEYFTYKGNTYEDQDVQTGGGGTGGVSFQDTYYIQNSDGSWKELFALSNSGERYLIGYGNNLVVVNDGQWQDGASNQNVFGSVGIFDPDTDTTSTESTNFFLTNFTGNGADPIGFLVASGTLSVQISPDYCFQLETNQSDVSYGIQQDDVSDLLPGENLYGGCVDGFYSIENGSLVQDHSAFQPFYMQAASQYQNTLTRSSTDWLSPLIGRTLQLVFAGTTTTAWQSFSNDFGYLSQTHPNVAYSDITTSSIQEAIEKQLAGSSTLVSETP